MKQCQKGDPLPHGGFTGSTCRKPIACKDEGRCYFVAGMERAVELGLPKESDAFRVNDSARIQACGSCGRAIWWGKTTNNKRNPYDVEGTMRTAISHFTTCPDAKQWSKSKTPATEPEVEVASGIRWIDGVDGYAWAL